MGNLGLIAFALITFSFLLSTLLCSIVRRVAPRLGLVDKPGGRKAHKAPTPLGGGVGIWLTVVLVLCTVGAAAWLGRSALPENLVPYIGLAPVWPIDSADWPLNPDHANGVAG